MAKLFENLSFWRDPAPRSGPENMAVDEWLLEHAAQPVLRVYQWEGDWLSLGYFGRLRDTETFVRDEPALRVVRRPTGGGLVDHRSDRTYTLAIPRGHPLSTMRGAESYRAIHEVLVEALGRAGSQARMVASPPPGASPECFAKPVEWDVVDGSARKIAGAGQRRTRHGLLHQGSVQFAGEGLFGSFADLLAEGLTTGLRGPAPAELAERVAKFARPAWLERR